MVPRFPFACSLPPPFPGLFISTYIALYPAILSTVLRLPLVVFRPFIPSRLFRQNHFAVLNIYHTRLDKVHASLFCLHLRCQDTPTTQETSLVAPSMRSSNFVNMDYKKNGHGVLVIQKPKPKPNPPPSNLRPQQNASTSEHNLRRSSMDF